MSGVDSLTTFNSTTKMQIRTFYENRCTFCLNKLVVEGSQCVHILDASGKGAPQVAVCSQLGIIPCDYRRQSQGNGIILCAGCHQGLFSYDYIALCPPKEVLEYLVKYVEDTPARNQVPLYQVLYELTASNPQGLPDPSAVLPYIGLYTIVHLKPTQLRDVTISTSFLPPLSILRNGQWENAPSRTASTAPNVARIFDSLAVNASGQCPSSGLIPLHPDQPDYSDKRYWRLPKTALGSILSAIVLRAIVNPSTADDELELVRVLHGLLVLRKWGGVEAGPSGEGRREDEGGRGRRGRRGGWRGGKFKGRRGTPQKRAAEEEGDTRKTRSSNKRHHALLSAMAGGDCSSQYNPENWIFGPAINKHNRLSHGRYNT